MVIRVRCVIFVVCSCESLVVEFGCGWFVIVILLISCVLWLIQVMVWVEVFSC